MERYIQCLVQSATKNPIKERFQEKGLTKAKDDRFTMRSYLTRQKNQFTMLAKNRLFSSAALSNYYIIRVTLNTDSDPFSL